jgi:hypothetical protein
MLAGALLLEPLYQPCFVLGFFEMGLMRHLPRLASNNSPPHLCESS